MRVGLWALLCAVPLSGCLTTPVGTAYQDVPHGAVLSNKDTPIELKVSSGSAEDDIANEAAEGYQLVGYSAFNGPRAGPLMERFEAKNRGASLVISGAKFTGSQAVGAVSGTTFTRHGAFTVGLPITVFSYDQVFLFFAKTPHIGTGIYAAPLKPTEHAALGTNKGVRVNAVIRGSPAFNAEVLPGDVVEAVNDKPVYDPASFDTAVVAAYGGPANLTIVRDGASISKVVSLPQGGAW